MNGERKTMVGEQRAALKPCPFCGVAVRMAHGFGKHWVVCDVCNFWSKSKHHEAEAAACWNTRAPSEREEFAQILAGLKARGVITQADIERLERDGVSRGDEEKRRPA